MEPGDLKRSVEAVEKSYQATLLNWLLDVLEHNRVLNYHKDAPAPEAVRNDTALAERIRSLRARLHPDAKPKSWQEDFEARMREPAVTEAP